jgi:hypothetical protein
VKSLKTYNLPQDVITILSKQPNKSEYVAKAVRHKYSGNGEISLDDWTNLELIQELRLRFGLMDTKSELLKTIIALL